MLKILSKFLILCYINPCCYGVKTPESYDFIVVGIGSAGSVLVNRLSSVPEYTVLALEAGGYANPLISSVPGFAAAMYYTSNNYRYRMEKQPNMALGSKDKRMLYSAGRGVGGTSLINMMLAIFPNRKDFDRWADLGNTGWDSRSILKYIRQFESAHIPNVNPTYRGTHGPISICETGYKTVGADAFLNASREMGMIVNDDYNGEKQQQGAGYIQTNTKNGLRCDGYTCLVKPISRRPNLKILIFTKVVKILIDPATKKAFGVLYFQSTTYSYKKAYAKKEVIVSAGALNSPKLLMLSGIGPKKHLESLGIKVIQDSPVGETMEDHLTFPGLVFKTKKQIGVNTIGTLLNPLNYVKLLLNQNSALSMPTLAIEAVSFINTNVSDKNRSVPELELLFVSLSLNSDYGLLLKQFFGISNEMYNAIFKPIENHYTWMLIPALYQPKSKGWIKLKSKNPFDDPLMYGNYFSDEKGLDMKTMISGVRFCQKLAKTKAFQTFGSEQVIPVLPGCEKHKLDSDEYWECFLRYLTTTFWHFVATCKMGPPQDKTAVVDPELNVYGVKNLRVVDNSIGPLVPGCHSNTLAFIIGFKGADMILQKYS